MLEFAMGCPIAVSELLFTPAPVEMHSTWNGAWTTERGEGRGPRLAYLTLSPSPHA